MTPPPINIDGTDITGATIDGADVSEVTVDGTQVFRPIPDSEDFEHNDLTGVYNGDTADPSIQTGTVEEGSFALQAGTNNTGDLLIRDAEQFERGVTVTWYVYGISGDNVGDSALAFVSSGTTLSDFDGYSLYISNSNFVIRRYDGGSSTNLTKATDDGSDNGLWQEWSATIGPDDITLTAPGGNSITATDATYTTVNLGFVCWGGQYIDNVQFS